MKLIYLSALDAKVVGKTGSLVRSKVLQNGGEYSKSFLFEQCSRDKAKLRAAVILLENEPDKENEDKEKYINTSILGQNVYEDGKYGPTYVQKKQVAVKLPYLLVEY